MLAVQSISKDNSVFNLWTSNPSFSNTAGTVNYSGGSNDAYTGNAGDVVDVTFKALAAGTASVKFASATALAADGQGTNVLGGTTGATIHDRRNGCLCDARQLLDGARQRRLFAIVRRRPSSRADAFHGDDHGCVADASRSKPVVQQQ